MNDRFHDSAGVPWEGRAFQENPWANDDGETPVELALALADKPVHKASLFSAMSKSRLLIPLVASLGEAGEGAHGQVVDKSADLAIVAVETPDKQTAIPVFSSVTDMHAWNAEARPVPVDAARVALAAAAEGHSRVILNPATHQVAIRRPALAAMAQGLDWVPPHEDPWVRSWLAEVAGRFSQITAVDVFDGDVNSDLAHAELLIQIALKLLSADEVKQLLTDFTDALRSEEFQQRVDSIGYRLVVAK